MDLEANQASDKTVQPQSFTPGKNLKKSLMQTAVNTCCLVICTFMLGTTFKTFLTLHSDEEEAAFMIRCRHFAKQYKFGDRPPTPARNFKTHWEFFCRHEWQRVVCLFTIGKRFPSVLCSALLRCTFLWCRLKLLGLSSWLQCQATTVCSSKQVPVKALSVSC